jgi:Domain of unknown function (DUF892)
LRKSQSHIRWGSGVSSNNNTCPIGFFSKNIKTINDLFVHTLRDIYYAEQQLVKALPKMVEKASDPGLKQAFQAHLGETKKSRSHAWSRCLKCTAREPFVFLASPSCSSYITGELLPIIGGYSGG